MLAISYLPHTLMDFSFVIHRGDERFVQANSCAMFVLTSEV